VKAPAESATGTAIHWPSLAAALVIMLGGTLYPPIFAGADGHPDHGLAALVFLAMSAGFVRGVGFIPRHPAWRWLFSGWVCLLALLSALALKLLG
jgi:predicted membrane protein